MQRESGWRTLSEGFCIDKAEAIYLVLLEPMQEGVPDQASHVCMPAVQDAPGPVVYCCVQASQ